MNDRYTDDCDNEDDEIDWKQVFCSRVDSCVRNYLTGIYHDRQKH